MPLYEYECDACGHRFEVIHQRFSDPPVEKCPKCGGPVHKLISSPAFQFKGTGWYVTDYAKKESTTTSGAEKGEHADAKSSASEKTDKSDSSTKTSGAEKSESSGQAAKSDSGKTEKGGTGATPPSKS